MQWASQNGDSRCRRRSISQRGATFAWAPQVTVVDNTASTMGVVVNWQAISGPVVLSAAQSQGSALGIAQTVATVGPLMGGGAGDDVGLCVDECVWELYGDGRGCGGSSSRGGSWCRAGD